MEKIYGYKENDVLGLANFLNSRQGGRLKDAFRGYAEKSGKAQGTVRNLYYALAKKSSIDPEFCHKYLGGKPLAVSKIVEFKKDEEEELVKAILKEKLNGKSVRRSISELANGDEKVALRYQNKFRNFIKNNPEKVESYTKELSKNCGNDLKIAQKELFDKAQIKKLKGEINGLIEKISLSVKKENDKLRAKNAYLEKENLLLRQKLGLDKKNDGALEYFLKTRGNRVFS